MLHVQAELLQAFAEDVKSTPMLGFLDKMKYWQLYCDMYPVMTDRGSGRFPSVFSEEFVQAYERQIADFKRHEPVTEPLKETVALSPPTDPAAEEFDGESTEVFDPPFDQADEA